MNNLYRVFYLLALIASIGVPSYVFAAAVEQEEKEEKVRESVYKSHLRRPSTGKTHDIKRRQNRPSRIETGPTKPGPVKIEPRKPLSKKELKQLKAKLRQQEDSPLMMAISLHDYKEVENLVLKKHAKIGVQNNFGETPLMRAAGYGDLKICEFLMRVYAHNAPRNISQWIDVQDEQGDTPLLYAVAGRHVPVVELLLHHGASVHTANKAKQTPLMMAAGNNDVKIINVLLKYLADKDLTSFALSKINEHGDTALQIAMRVRAQDAEKLLLQVSGALDLDALRLINAAKAGDVKEVDALLAHKVNVNYRYGDQTPLFVAVMGDSPQAMLAIVTKLLSVGADPNVLGFGYTPLIFVAGKHFDRDWESRMKDGPVFSAIQCKIIEALLAGGADIEGVVNGQASTLTPLICAIKKYNIAVAEFLIDNGASLKAQSQGKSVTDCVRGLFAKLKDYPNAFNQWAFLLFDIGIDLDPISKTPEGVLFKAINHGDVKRVAELLAHDPKPNIEAVFENFTPLICAITRDNVAVMHELIAAGVDINRGNAQGFTPLMEAITRTRLPQALILLDAGAYVNEFDNSVNTALIWFAATPLHDEQCIQVLNRLLECGALATTRNIKGQSALDLVRVNEDADPKIKQHIIKILQEAEKRQTGSINFFME